MVQCLHTVNILPFVFLGKLTRVKNIVFFIISLLFSSLYLEKRAEFCMPKRNLMNTDVAKILDQAGFFEGISKESKEALSKYCMPVARLKNTILFRESEPGEAMFLLARGRISLHKLTPEGREVVIKVLKPGEVFAEVILFEQKSYPVTAIALTEALAFKLLRRDLLQLLRQEDFRNDFIAMLLRKQRYLADKIQQMTSQDVEQRLRAFLAEQYGEREQIQADINKKQLASAIGVNPETLSRLLQDLKLRKLLLWKQGVISVAPGFWESD
jgi:CRP-like cAMP-binding protein